MTRPRPHRCDTGCVCPVHHTQLLYARTEDDHACQDRDCVYAHGVKAAPTTWMCTNQITAIDRETEQPFQRECGYKVEVAYPPDLLANRDRHLADCTPIGGES